MNDCVYCDGNQRITACSVDNDDCQASVRFEDAHRGFILRIFNHKDDEEYVTCGFRFCPYCGRQLR